MRSLSRYRTIAQGLVELSTIVRRGTTGDGNQFGEVTRRFAAAS
jgi:hypothetical protein